jgi:hypothetical protein
MAMRAKMHGKDSETSSKVSDNKKMAMKSKTPQEIAGAKDKILDMDGKMPKM